MWVITLGRLLRVALYFALLTLAACASTEHHVHAPVPKTIEPFFPPHEVMQNQLYSAFLVENQDALLRCSEESQCTISLFNLGFIYSYPYSPYFNQTKGRYYFNTLIEKYPHNSFSSLARVWIELINRCISAESVKHQLKGKLKSKEVAIKELQKKVEEKTGQVEEKTGQVEMKTEAMEKVRDADIDRVEKEIRKKLEQSRAIDVEIERKERELTR